MTRKAWGPGNPLYDWQQRHVKGRRAKRARHSRVRGGFTARRRGHSRRSGGIGGLLSTRNLLGTIGGGMVAGPAGAAAGSYLVGKKGLLGAAIAFVAAPYIIPQVQKLVGGFTTGSSGSGGSW